VSWDPISNPQDHVTLGGRRSPGIATLVGWSDRRRWDERQGYGLSGATLIYQGRPLCRGKIRFLLTTPEQFAEWGEFQKAFAVPAPVRRTTAFEAASSDTIVQRRPRPQILDIVHPQLADLGVTRVVLEERPQMDQDDTGAWTVEISLIEHRPPVRSVDRPTSSTVAAPVLTARQQHIAALTSQGAALASGVNEAPP
jgi:hypothetical protein